MHNLSFLIMLWSTLVATVMANGNMTFSGNQSTITSQFVTTSTQVVTAYTTYCPDSTTFTEGNKTYTATGPTTLTVTDCPCTRTHTFTTQYVTVCASDTPSVIPSQTTNVEISNGGARPGLSLAALFVAGALFV